MLKPLFLSALAASSFAASGAFAQEADAAAGESAFRSCKSCHTIANGDEVIVRGGRTGPNLYGVIGRAAGSYEGFRYSGSMTAAGEAGLVWTEEALAEFITNPTAYLRTYLDDSGARSKMSFKARGDQADIAAYLASLAPMMEMEGMGMGMEGSEGDSESSEESSGS